MEKTEASSDVILIGAGVMSATLGAILKEVAPDWKITVYEKLSGSGEESSNEWNNAGTGHAALCELNYTSEKSDGTIDISKAIKINEQFQVSKQFWSYLVERGYIDTPQSFIMPLPHISIVHGEKNEQFLNRRFEAMSKHPFFSDMEYTTNHDVLKTWFPLIMNGRKTDEIVAATRIASGTDVNFGALTRQLMDHLEKQNVTVQYNHQVLDFKKLADHRWEVKVKDLKTGVTKVQRAKFVFIGGGGGSLHLLQKTGIAESKSIGGFPVSGLFLVCNNPDVVNEHHAKVYGKAKVGAPPMSVPHLDTRFIDNKKTLLFGPFAGFTPKFLKTGSLFDLIKSVKPHNVITMLAAGVKEMSLTKYLVQQVLLSQEKRIEELRDFIPNAKAEDWSVIIAGQRVQVIKDTQAGGKGTLQFGTEVVSAEDGSVAALLGASPGASTAVSVMLEVIEKCFPQHIDQWTNKLKEMVPSYKVSLEKNEQLQRKLQVETDSKLKLNNY